MAAQNKDPQQPTADVKQETAQAEEKPTADVKAQPKKYKLKDPKTQYAEGSFTLADKQEKGLPASPSPELRKRIKAGFIIEVK